MPYSSSIRPLNKVVSQRGGGRSPKLLTVLQCGTSGPGEDRHSIYKLSYSRWDGVVYQGLGLWG